MTDSNPEGAAAHAVALMADVSVWSADDWRRLLDAAAAGATVDGLLRQPTARVWANEARAAFDQGLQTAGEFPSADFWVARASAAAAIESAEQATIANLLQWQALQVARQGQGIDMLPIGGDEVTTRIEKGLGLA
jgi:hypothetical protein